MINALAQSFAILTFVGLIGASGIQASELRGSVALKSKNGPPVEGVAINSDGAAPATSDSLGYFRLDFPNLKPGQNVRLKISKPGMIVFDENKLQVLLPADPQQQQIDIVLFPESERGELVMETILQGGSLKAIDELKRGLDESKRKQIDIERKLALLIQEMRSRWEENEKSIQDLNRVIEEMKNKQKSVEEITHAVNGLTQERINIAATAVQQTQQLEALEVSMKNLSVSQTMVERYYSAGGTVTITGSINYSGAPSSLAWSTVLPSGWSLESTEVQAIDLKPIRGTTGLIEWAWTTIPSSPVVLRYTVKVPVGTTGNQQISSLVTSRYGLTNVSVLAKPDPFVISERNVSPP